MKVENLINILAKYNKDEEVYVSCKTDGIHNELEIQNVLFIECAFNEPLGFKSGVHIVFD